MALERMGKKKTRENQTKKSNINRMAFDQDDIN